MDNTTSWIPWIIVYWRMFDCMRIRHEREQDRINRDGCFLPVHTLVGETELAVRLFL